MRWISSLVFRCSAFLDQILFADLRSSDCLPSRCPRSSKWTLLCANNTTRRAGLSRGWNLCRIGSLKQATLEVYSGNMTWSLSSSMAVLSAIKQFDRFNCYVTDFYQDVIFWRNLLFALFNLYPTLAGFWFNNGDVHCPWLTFRKVEVFPFIIFKKSKISYVLRGK